jgi:hypothetical protein
MILRISMDAKRDAVVQATRSLANREVSMKLARPGHRVRSRDVAFASLGGAVRRRGGGDGGSACRAPLGKTRLLPAIRSDPRRARFRRYRQQPRERRARNQAAIDAGAQQGRRGGATAAGYLAVRHDSPPQPRVTLDLAPAPSPRQRTTTFAPASRLPFRTGSDKSDRLRQRALRHDLERIRITGGGIIEMNRRGDYG